MSELALKLIAENRRTRATFLDLGNCGLRELPREIGELVWLEELNLASVWFEWEGATWVEKRSQNDGQSNGIGEIGQLGGLRNLRRLNLVGNPIVDARPVAGLSSLQTLDVSNTQVTDLQALAGLASLQTLHVSNTQVTDLQALAGLASLQTLDVSGTQVTDLQALAGLASLQTLNVSGTQVTDLQALAGLASLQTLNVSNTQVTDLRALAGLASLQTLDVSNTQVTDLQPLAAFMRPRLPVRWSSESWRAAGIYVADCPLRNPPPEIVQQGNEAILNYFQAREGVAVDHLYEAKMLLVGKGGAGKTSLLRRLYQPERPLPAEDETTRGISIYRHEFRLANGRMFRLNVWDFGGQEIYHSTHQFFLTHRSLYVLLDDTRSDNKSVSDPEFRDWLERVEVFGGHSPVLIFQNEKGGRSKTIDFGGIKRQYDNVRELYSGDLLRADAVERLRAGIEFFAGNLSHIGEELPASWVKVRSDIEVRAQETPHISQQEYFQIYGRHLEFDRTKALHLSRYLHDLGVFLHFQDHALLGRTVILQNPWATEAVFRMLDDEVVKGQSGRFTETDCRRVWRDSVYADMHLELLALMERFELCYQLRDCHPAAWLVPQLLPAPKPDKLTGWGKAEDMVRRFRYEFLPKGMISRLTVRLNRYVREPAMAWITGVLFEQDHTDVLVELLANGSEIELRARGPEAKGLLSVVAAELDALNDSFAGLRGRFDQWVPCNCKLCGAAIEPEFFAYKDLVRRKGYGRLRVECPRSYEEVSVIELLEGVRVDEMPRWAKEDAGVVSVRTIRIFLASSAELREDRDAFDLHFRRRNDFLRKKGMYLEIVCWENFLDAMSETRLQDEYNRAVRECDVVVCLFFTKAGKFTGEEFEVALRQFKETGKPRIFTYFKDAQIRTGSARRQDLNSLWDFQEKLQGLGHFWTPYENTEHLKRHFGDQIERLFG